MDEARGGVLDGFGIIGPKRVVVLGMLSRLPVSGVAWLVAQYLIGFRRLGFDVFYVDEPARMPTAFMKTPDDDCCAPAAAYIQGIMRRLDLGDRWAFLPQYRGGTAYGLSEEKLNRVYDSAELVINLHGGTHPRPPHFKTGRLVYLETDPVALQIDLHHGVQERIDYLRPHVAFFTWAINYGNPDCQLPVSQEFHFRPTLPPVVLDWWQADRPREGRDFTTIGNWRQPRRTIDFAGQAYTWSKHHEFEKFLDVPRVTGQTFGLALSRYEDEDQDLLEKKGWKVRDAADLSGDMDLYREYIAASRGEFTVAKDQNVRLRSGWFSERSATYLAAGKPVITQDTGFGNVLPTGEGLFAFSNQQQIEDAIETINGDYRRHAAAARALAREYFSSEVVLSKLIREIGL